MIKLEIKNVSSPDVELWSDIPPANDVYFLLQLEIGEQGDDRKDLFQIMVATPEGLRARAKASVLADRATLVVSELDWNSLLQELGKIVQACNGCDWNDSVSKLQRYFRWEYEDYVKSE